jgi:ABC-2 type transport system permease protein
MKKFLKISSKLIQMNFMRNIIYNFDFLISIFNTIVYTVTFLLVNELVFETVDTIYGYSKEQFIVFILFGQVWFYLQVIFVRKNFQYLNELVSTGKINYELIKPYSLRAYSFLFRFDFRMVIALCIIGSYLVYQLTLINLSILQILGGFVFWQILC